MRWRLFILIALLLGSGLIYLKFGQTTTTLTYDGWERDFDKALSQATEEDKYILLNFGGSDWCLGCAILDEDVFSKPLFKSYAQENLICAVADFPRRTTLPKEEREQNQKLKQKYNVIGVPTVILLNSEGKLVAEPDYQLEKAAEYVEYLKEMIRKYEAGFK